MSSNDRSDLPGQRARAGELFAVLAWIVCAIVLVRYVARYAAPLPFADDVLMAPYVDPHEPLSGYLLWLRHNDHRIPLVKLVYVALVGGLHDLRAGCWFQAGALLALSAAFLWGLRRRAGRLTATDAVIPLALLTTSNSENLLNSFQVAFGLPVLLAGGLLARELFVVRPASWRGNALIGLVLLALVACGNVGIVMGAVFALGLACVAVSGWRARTPDWKSGAAVAVVAIAAFLVFLEAYFTEFEHLAGHERPGLASFSTVALQFLSCGIGAMAMPIWPWSGIAVLSAFGVGVFVLARALRAPEARELGDAGACGSGGAQRGLALALLVQIAAGLALALAIAYGRASDAPTAGFVNRYVVLSALPLCAAYLALRLYGRGVAARLGELGSCAIVLAGFVGNYEFAFMQGHGRSLIVRRFEKLAKEGAGVAELANTGWSVFYYEEAPFRELLGQWRRAGFLDGVLSGERVADLSDPLALLPATRVPVESDAPLAARLVGGRYMVQTRGRARFEFVVPASADRFHAHIELDPCGRDPRLHVRVLGRTASGVEGLLFERELAPRTRPEDGAGMGIDLDLSADELSTLELRLEPAGASGSPRFGLLSGVAFRPGR